MFEAGEIVDERYEVIGPLGRGGQATVHEARALDTGAVVALKVLLADEQGRFASGPASGFRAEAEMMRGLRHAHLPAVYEYFERVRYFCLVLEYIPGRTLDQVGRLEGPLAEGRVLEWARQLCEVLDYLHARRPPVIFRDLKPGNVMLEAGEHIRLIDFGIAKWHDEQVRRMTRTAARGMLSRGYAAFEQYIGGTDARSDVYALGATLFHLLTGEAPPDALEVASGRLALADVRALRSDVSESTAQAIHAMMQPDRARRPASAREVMRILGLAPSSGRGVLSGPSSGTDAGVGEARSPEWPQRVESSSALPRASAESDPSPTEGPATEAWRPEACNPLHPGASPAEE